MTDLVQLGLTLFGMVAAAAATYGAIRTDLKHLHSAVAEAKQTADTAHRRIDKILLRGAD